MTYTLRPAEGTDLARLVAIINAGNPEPVSAEQQRRSVELAAAAGPMLRLVAETPDGLVVGYGVASRHLVDLRPGTYRVFVVSDPAHRGQGVGRALYAPLLQWLQMVGAQYLHTWVRESEPASLSWAQSKGYMKQHHMFESRLNLPEWDPRPYWPVVERAQAGGIRFSTLAAEGLHDDHLRRFYSLDLLTVSDDPSMAGTPGPTFERWLQLRTGHPQWDPEGVCLAIDGDTWAGCANLIRMPSGGMYNAGTGVARSYRGRGLGVGLKVVSLQWAQRQGVPYVRTNNDSQNVPMISINRKLGYIPAPGTFSLVKELPVTRGGG